MYLVDSSEVNLLPGTDCRLCVCAVSTIKITISVAINRSVCFGAVFVWRLFCGLPKSQIPCPINCVRLIYKRRSVNVNVYECMRVRACVRACVRVYFIHIKLVFEVLCSSFEPYYFNNDIMSTLTRICSRHGYSLLLHFMVDRQRIGHL